jgi:predicted  nucleic acid-binding Zn-ribbon protein
MAIRLVSDVNLHIAPSKVDDSAAEKTIESLQAEIEGLKNHAGEYEKIIADLKDDVEATEKERDFYFEKLRDIEILLQGKEGLDEEWVKDIFKILYATAEGFEVVTGEATDSEEVNEESY